MPYWYILATVTVSQPPQEGPHIMEAEMEGTMNNIERVAAFIDSREEAESIRLLLSHTFKPRFYKLDKGYQHIGLVVGEVFAGLDNPPANK